MILCFSKYAQLSVRFVHCGSAVPLFPLSYCLADSPETSSFSLFCETSEGRYGFTEFSVEGWGGRLCRRPLSSYALTDRKDRGSAHSPFSCWNLWLLSTRI